MKISTFSTFKKRIVIWISTSMKEKGFGIRKSFYCVSKASAAEVVPCERPFATHYLLISTTYPSA